MSEVISVGIFKEPHDFHTPEEIKLTHLIHTLNPKKSKGNSVHTYADPFLFEHQNQLYLFAEIQEVGAAGYLNAWQYQADQNWQDLGPILKQDTHLSYPFLFRDTDGAVYMIPESGQSGELNIWSFDSFPHKIRKQKTLLSGRYADSSIHLHEGVYYLFTTNEQDEMLIFFNDALLGNIWTPHPCNPITNDKKISRNGGGLMAIGPKLMRVAQNCTERYGGGIVLLTVEELSKTDYKEDITIADFRPSEHYDWQKLGRHHLSICNFKGNTFAAIDGYASVTLLHRILNKISRSL